MQAKDYKKSFTVDEQGVHTIFTVPKTESPIIIELHQPAPPPAETKATNTITEVAPIKIVETIPKLTHPPKNMSYEDAIATIRAFLRDHKELTEQQRAHFIDTVAGKINLMEVLGLVK